MYNIKLQPQWLYFRYLIWLLFFLILFIVTTKFGKYYVYFYAFNNVAFLFWIGLDAFDYYTSFVVWLVTLSMSLTTNVIHSYFFFNNFTDKETYKKYFYDPFFKINRLVIATDLRNSTISNQDCSVILYSWLNNPNTTKSDDTLEKIFDNPVNRIWWDKYYDFFTKLYKLSFFCNLSSEKYSIYYLNNSVQRLNIPNYKGSYNGFLSHIYNTNLLNKYTALSMSHILNSYKNYHYSLNNKSNSIIYLKSRYGWNLLNTLTEGSTNSHLIRFKSGTFFFHDLVFNQLINHTSLFNELRAVTFSLKNQTTIGKWNRWLYRYSILHRKILKNSHKITISKRLLNCGMYNNSLFNKNIWSSENFKKYTNNKFFFNNISNLYYGDLFYIKNTPYCATTKTFLSNNLNYLNNALLLSFYETSYFWFIKRFYNFNTLPNNFIKSSVQFENNFPNELRTNLSFTNTALSKYFISLSYLLKSNYFVNPQFNHLNSFAKPSLLENSHNSYNFKDLVTLLNDNDILESDNLDLLYWLTSSSISTNLKLSFFNYLNTISIENNNYRTFSLIKNTNQSFHEFNYWLIRSSFNIDNFYIKDASIFTLFY